ncbi:MAG: hypothetical protein IJL58_05330 [Bacteroidales bacterium]|nr:hypothetical protein [Bacteroidales bacterium]
MTIKEIWESSNAEQRRTLQSAVMNDGVGATAAWKYLTGRQQPMKLYKESIREHVRRILGVEVTTEELFRV